MTALEVAVDEPVLAPALEQLGRLIARQAGWRAELRVGGAGNVSFRLLYRERKVAHWPSPHNPNAIFLDLALPGDAGELGRMGHVTTRSGKHGLKVIANDYGPVVDWAMVAARQRKLQWFARWLDRGGSTIVREWGYQLPTARLESVKSSSPSTSGALSVRPCKP
jgi:hypothetical protein